MVSPAVVQAGVALGSAILGGKKGRKQEKSSNLLQALMAARARRMQEQNVAFQLQSLAGGRSSRPPV